MRSLLSFTLLTMPVLGAIAQAKTGLTDDLLKDKQQSLAKYIPMSDGQYLFAAYQIPLDSFLQKTDAFQAAMRTAIDKAPASSIRELQMKDLAYFKRNVLQHYKLYYGMDSLGISNMEKIVVEKKGQPDYMRLLDSASKKVFLKKLDMKERAYIDSLCNLGADMNDAALFKRSAAYRTWVDTRITALRTSKYAKDTTLGYEGNNVVKLKVVANEITDPFIKEYLAYTLTGTVLKMVRNAEAKEKAYEDFMSVAVNPVYKAELKEIYTNYKNMTSSAIAPDFVYNTVEGKKVALKDLRGKYVYIDVWATWCGPCKAEIPFLTKVEEDYHGKNIHFVSLSVDRIADKGKWQTYVKDHQLQGIQLLADNDFNSDFIKKFNINSIPRFILIGPDGKIISGDAKRPSDPELRRQLDTLL